MQSETARCLRDGEWIGDLPARELVPGDLVEIRYTGRLEDGTVFDGMELAERFFDDSIQFVLGRQPAPRGALWHLLLLYFVVGLRARLGHDAVPRAAAGRVRQQLQHAHYMYLQK